MERAILYTYLDRLDIPTGNLEVFYSFSSGSGNVVFNDVYGVNDHFFNGTCLREDRRPGLSVGRQENPTSNVISGSGIFSYNDLVRIGNLVDFTEWTTFINYKALNYCDVNDNLATILLSSAPDENIGSGFIFGINQANRAYFEYNDGNSKKLYTLNKELGPQNVLSLSKLESTVEITYHDYQHQDNIRLAFDVSGYNHSDNWYIGGMFDTNGLYTGLSGYVDDFLLFDRGFDSTTKNSLVDAFFVTGILPPSFTLTTGYVSSILDVFLNPTGNLTTGITSYSTSGTVTIAQLSGSGIDLCRIVGNTGFITGETIEYTTGGPVAVLVSTANPEQVLIDYGYLMQFTKPIFVYPGGITTGDIIECYGYKKLVPTNNIHPTYNPILKTFDMPTSYTGENVNPYLNGIYQISGTGYEVRYDKTVRRLYNVDWSGNVDNVLVDIIGGSQAYYDFTGGQGTLALSNSSYAGRDFYLNGQKLVSGLDYTGNGNDYHLLLSENYGTGLLHFAPRRTDIDFIRTGNVSFNLETIINDQIWLNGQRLDRNVDFFKTSYCSLKQVNDLSGFDSLVYDNNGLFFDL